jgi:glycerol-3-phosphate acyltransferase PlsY
MSNAIFIVAASYLLGSIPFGFLLVRIFWGEDVRLSGSGNIGATNVSRKSPVLGVLTLVLDALKGSAAVAIGLILSPAIFERIAIPYIPWRYILPASKPDFATWAALAALFAVIGHMFPVWLKFRGGKGVATGLGSFVLIAPKVVLFSATIFLVVVLISRYVSLASIMAVMLFPSMVWQFHAFGGAWPALAFISLASVLIIVQHRQNIRRLLAGTEHRMGAKRTGHPQSK